HHETTPSFFAPSYNAAIAGESLDTAVPGLAAGTGVVVAATTAGAVVGLGAAVGAAAGGGVGAVVGLGAAVGAAGAAGAAGGVGWAQATSSPAPDTNPSMCRKRRLETTSSVTGGSPLAMRLPWYAPWPRFESKPARCAAASAFHSFRRGGGSRRRRSCSRY